MREDPNGLIYLRVEPGMIIRVRPRDRPLHWLETTLQLYGHNSLGDSLSWGYRIIEVQLASPCPL